MKVNLNLLPYIFDNEKIKIPEEYYKDTDILSISEVLVTGKIYYNVTDDIEIKLSVSLEMMLKDANTLENVKYPISFEIDEILTETEGENEKYFEKTQNILDIIEFLWENIVLEVPIRVTNEENVHLKGDGWELNKTQEDDNIDPRMEKLSEIFKGGE